MRLFPSTTSEPVEADRFSLFWPDPGDHRAVCVCLWRHGEIVFEATFIVCQLSAWIEEWTCEPFGIDIADMPWWLENRIRKELD